MSRPEGTHDSSSQPAPGRRRQSLPRSIILYTAILTGLLAGAAFILALIPVSSQAQEESSAGGLNPPAPPEGAGEYDFQMEPSAAERAALDAIKGKIPGFIIFESNRGGQWHLYRMNADGTGVHQLTAIAKANTGEPTYACISPDGRTIAWEHRYNSSDGEIWLMNSDGTNQRPLYQPAGHKDTRANRPTWLPDGRLKFSRGGSMQKQSIWIYDFNAKDPKVTMLDKILDKEPEMVKNQKSWQEELLLDMREMPKDKRYQTKRLIVHELTPDLKGFVAWCRYPGRGVWWMSLDGAIQEKIHGGCSPRVMPDGQNFIWVITAGKFAIGSLSTPVKSQLLYGGPYHEVYDHGYFPYLTPDYQHLVFSACPFNQHDQETSNYQIFIAKMGAGLKPEGAPVRLTFNQATDRYPVMWYPGMVSPATPPVISGEAHKTFGGPDDPGPGEDQDVEADAESDEKQEQTNPPGDLEP